MVSMKIIIILDCINSSYFLCEVSIEGLCYVETIIGYLLVTHTYYVISSNILYKSCVSVSLQYLSVCSTCVY